MNLELSDLKKLYVHELKDLYSAETQIAKALPKMVDAAKDKDLKKAFKDHLKETQQQIKRLETIFKGLEFKPGGHKCEGMEGLLKEGSELMREKAPAAVTDAGLVASAQRVEHYEIAGYGVARTYAEKLGEYAAADLLQESLNEEALADQKLSRLAQRKLNFQALAA
jgi:ferritin-like metal-binding protein YciE